MAEKQLLLPLRSENERSFSRDEDDKEASVDEMLKCVGEYSLFQWLLDVIFGIMMMTQTYHFLLMYFAGVSPSWRCIANSTKCPYPSNLSISADNNSRCSMPRSEWEFTEPKDFSIATQFDIYCSKQWLIYLATSAFFIGWGIGAIFLGWVADNYGRKLTLFPSNMLVLFFGFIMAFSPNIWLFLVFRFLVGFFVSGCLIQMLMIIAELVGTKHRPAAVIIIFMFFNIALCILAFMAYYIRQWKNLLIMCTVPYVFIILFYKFVPESVRWLCLHGKKNEAMQTFERMAKWNKRKIPENLVLSSPSKNTSTHKSNPLYLFKGKKALSRTMAQGYIWLINGMVYYGLALAAGDLGGSIYRNFVLITIADFPATLLAIFFSVYFGRKKTALSTMLLTGVACVTVAFIPKSGDIKFLRITMAMLGKMFITISYDTIGVWSGELYPTTLRVEAVSFLQLCSRLGAATAPWVANGLASFHQTLPFNVMGGATFLAAALILVLPETNGMKLPETLEEDEDK